MSALTIVDLFCGAGGFSLGFQCAGFKVELGIDADEKCVATFRANFGGAGEQSKVSLDLVASLKADVVVGGPPCQPFSLLGSQEELDPRRGLTKQYMDAVEAISPNAFVIENVPGYFKSSQAAYVRRRSKKLGYTVVAEIIDAADHGVAQRRKRAFIIGSRLGTPFFPAATHHSHKTVHDAIGDLSGLPNNDNWHTPRHPDDISVLRYCAIPKGGNRFSLPRTLQPPCWRKKPTGSVDVFGRLWWDRPAVTMRTEFVKPEKGRYLHPEQDRPITAREGARLQSFPDSFAFKGSMTSVVRQIGNAVPPRLAYRLALALKSHLAGAQGELTSGDCLAGIPRSRAVVQRPSGSQDRVLQAELLREQ